VWLVGRTRSSHVHPAALKQCPAAYEQRVVSFFDEKLKVR
jgi:hypothetical protein